jgi:hypothetical protein
MDHVACEITINPAAGVLHEEVGVLGLRRTPSYSRSGPAGSARSATTSTTPGRAAGLELAHGLLQLGAVIAGDDQRVPVLCETSGEL